MWNLGLERGPIVIFGLKKKIQKKKLLYKYYLEFSLVYFYDFFMLFFVLCAPIVLFFTCRIPTKNTKSYSKDTWNSCPLIITGDELQSIR